MESMETEKKAALEAGAPCPCGSGRSYGECCGPCLEDGVWPETAEALMRARFSGFVLGKYQFLADSFLPASRDAEHTADKIAEASQGVTWVRLDVLKTGGHEDVEGLDCETVDYVAYYRYGENTMQVGEHACFCKGEDGRIYYAAGETLRREPFKREAPKVGRNDPCPCGSGKKYKKCCGRGQA